jgi:predicted transcriptional regulator
MTITLSEETQMLLEDRMRIAGYQSADEAVRALLQAAADVEEDRSPETLEAIRRGMADAEAGRTRPWEDFEKQWMERGPKK